MRPRTGNIAAVLASAALLSAAAARGETENWVKAFSLEGVDRVRVENVNGRVHASSWDKPYVRISAVKTGSPRALEHTIIRATQKAGEIRIETVGPRHHSFFHLIIGGDHMARVDYDVLLPARTNLKLESVNGSVSSEGCAGELSVETVNGRAEVHDSRGSVRAETVNGRIEISAADCSHDIRLETVNGTIEALCPANASLRYHLETVNGHLEAAGRTPSGRSFGPKDLSGEIAGGHAHFSAESVNGSITLKLAETAAK
jgi:hypothetical protein